MHSRFFSVVCLFVFIVFSSNTLYAQVNPPTTTQCSDGLDNDTDGKVDFGGTNPDPGCSSATDTDETNSSVAVNITFPFCLPACLDGQSCSTTCPLVCPAGSTRTPTPESPVCFLTITPTTSPAGTVFSLSGYSHLTGNCTLASSAAQTTPVSPILPSGGSLGLVVSSTVSSVTAATAATFTTTAQAASILTCPSGAPVCSLGAGGIISCGCFSSGITPPAVIIPPIYTCVSDLCAEGQYYCSAEKTCKPAGATCSAFTCNKNDTCEVGESCNCSDCTKGVLTNDQDKCGLSVSGQQLYCTKDSVVSSNTTFPFCLPACLDGQACTTTCTEQVGACCPAGSTWSSATKTCVPTTCGKGQFYCAIQKKCLAGGTTCDTAVCDNNGTCSGEESCQCADCVNGGTDDKDKCSIIGGIQAMCSDDNLTDGKPGACCVPPESWDTATATCAACTNTQAPSEIKADFDQPYITCTGNGNPLNTHFRYRLTKTAPTNTDTPFVSELFTLGTSVLHPKMTTGTYTVQCFYGTATTVDVSNTATPHSCEKTMNVREANTNNINGCSRIYAYKGSTLSDEMTSPAAFSASFRCGSRLPSDTVTNPFILRLGTTAPAFLLYDTVMSEFFNGFAIGPISTQTNNYDFVTGSTPVSCAVRVGGGYSTNDYCRLNACVGDGCNVPKAFSVVYSGDTLCTTRAEDTYSIGCNPDAPESIRTACVEMFQAAISAKSNTVRDGIAFRVKFNFNSSTPTEVECVKYGAGKMPSGLNLYDNVACKALLKNGEFYDIYVADTGGSPINSLQTTSRTVERDTEIPRLESLKYFTDSSLTTEVASGVWSSKPVIAVAVCSDSPRGESLACSCAPSVSQSTTDSSTWSLGTLHGTVEIGADLLRYTRTIAENLVGNQTIGVVDTAGNVSPTQTFTLSLDTKSPIVAVTESAISGATRTLTLTATDTDSRIWKNRTAPTGAQPNTNGIIYRMGPKENAETLAFDAECSVTPATSNFANVLESATLQTSATVSIPSVNTTTTIVAYCVRDNAGNTTRGIYPVLTDSCFSATNMTKVPTFDDYRSLTSTRLTSAPTLNQKYGYSFSENTTNAACFRGILATNIQTLITNQLTPRTSTSITNWDSDRAFVKNSTTLLNTNGYYYFSYPSLNTLTLSVNPTGTGTKSVVVEGGNILIKNNINYTGSGKTLILIARRNSAGVGGDVIVDPSVTRIDAIIIADGGTLQSADAMTPGERLTINGRLYSYNTRGGSLSASGTDVIDSTTPRRFTAAGVIENATSLIDAQKQDLERLRPIYVDSSNTCSLSITYHAYTTSTLPVLLQRPVGYQGGNCGF